MGANLKSVIPQSIQPSSEAIPLPVLYLHFSSIASLNEIQRLSQFLPVIVLVPKSTIKNQTDSCSIVVAKSTTSATERESFGPLDEAVAQLGKPNPRSEFAFGDVKINFSEMTASRKDQPVTLTAMEFKALQYLIQNARRVISRNELLNEVWGYENYPSTRTVDNHILRLRQKLEREPSEPRHFITVHRTGYKFVL
jgi:DNA-binding winged helix-turn-helix (wHTH) protein